MGMITRKPISDLSYSCHRSHDINPMRRDSQCSRGGGGYGSRRSSMENTSSRGVEKYTPAYEGAKFDKSGYCLKHPMVRLCRPSIPSDKSHRSDSSQEDAIDSEVKYLIVRKTCHMCGEHSLRNERKLNTTTLHGCKPPEPYRRRSQDMMAAQSHSSDRYYSSDMARSPNSDGGNREYCRELRNDSLRESGTPYLPHDGDRRRRSRSRGRREDRHSNRPSGRSKSASARPRRDSSVHSTRSQRSRRSSHHHERVPSVDSRKSAKTSQTRELRERSSSRSGRRRRSRGCSRDKYSNVSSSRSCYSSHTSQSSYSRRGTTSGVINRKKSSSSFLSSHCSGSKAFVHEPKRGRSKHTNASSASSVCTISTTKSTKRNPRSRSRSCSLSVRTSRSRSRKEKSMACSASSVKSSKSTSSNKSTGSFTVRSLKDRTRARSKSLSSRISTHFRRQNSNVSAQASSTSVTSSSTSGSSRSSRSPGHSCKRSSMRSSRHSRRSSSNVCESGNEELICNNRYEVPFNPGTGRCKYHSNICLAVKNPRGGWQMVRDSCPKCNNGY